MRERLEEGLEESSAEGLDQGLHTNQHYCLEMVWQNQITIVCQCSLLEIRSSQNLKICSPHEILKRDLWQECYQVVVMVVVVMVMVVVMVKDALLSSPV